MNPYMAAILAALLFGVGTPIAKLILPGIHPFAFSGLLYLGAGISAWIVVSVRRRMGAKFDNSLVRGDILPVIGTILFGGVLGPCLLFFGLARTSALAASLLLNLETVFTVLIAVSTGEKLTRREAVGCALIVVAAALVTFDPSGPGSTTLIGSLAVVAACAAWGADNNIVRALAKRDPLEIVRLKGLAAAPVSLTIAFGAGATLPGTGTIGIALVLGAISYGASVALFVSAVRHLGAARTGALFAIAPFAGALLSVLMGDPVTPLVIIGGLIMASGVRLLITATKAQEVNAPEKPPAHEASSRSA